MSLLTVRAFAREYHMGQATVRRLIATDAAFPAVDIAESGHRPRYRIATAMLPAWVAAHHPGLDPAWAAQATPSREE